MNSNTLLAFLYAIRVEDIQDSTLIKLGTQLKIQPGDWEAVQEKLDNILTTYPKLQQSCTHFQTQLEGKNTPDLLALLSGSSNQSLQPATRSAVPGLPDKETMEIINTAVKILHSEKPTEMAKQLLQPLNETPKSSQPKGNH